MEGVHQILKRSICLEANLTFVESNGYMFYKKKVGLGGEGT